MTHIRSFTDGSRLDFFDPRLLKNVHVATFYRYKMHHIFGHGHYGIFVL